MTKLFGIIIFKPKKSSETPSQPKKLTKNYLTLETSSNETNVINFI